ncbi:MAG: type II secretion system F family protein [Deltaproteobacteria bacterium]|nr:type II secretion system F family protein [Deltaproteobacteria bacterium]
MMTATPQTLFLGWLALFLAFVGVTGAIYITLSDPESPLAKLYHDYSRHLDGELRALFIHTTTGKVIAGWQLGLGSLTLVMQLIMDDPVALVFLPLIAVGPKVWLINQRSERQTKIEAQMDTLLLCLANALKASPSLGDALNACTLLMRVPIKEELELTMKENTLGVPLDEALLNMARRVDSRAFSGCLSTVLIGRQTGGDLPRILETAAATLREMARLEGVVRSKTAEGKAQAWLLGCLPPVLVGLLNWIDPEWLRPLSTTFVGYIVVGVAVAFWVAAVFAARKILAVDI